MVVVVGVVGWWKIGEARVESALTGAAEKVLIFLPKRFFKT